MLLFESMQNMLKILPGFGDNLVGSEDPHAVEGRLGLVLGGELATDDSVLLESPLALHFVS